MNPLSVYAPCGSATLVLSDSCAEPQTLSYSGSLTMPVSSMGRAALPAGPLSEHLPEQQSVQEVGGLLYYGEWEPAESEPDAPLIR